MRSLIASLVSLFVINNLKRRHLRKVIKGISAQEKRIIQAGLPGLEIKSFRFFKSGTARIFLVNDNLVVKSFGPGCAAHCAAASAILREHIDGALFPDIKKLHGTEDYMYYPFLPGNMITHGNVSEECLSDIAHFIARMHAIDTDKIPKELMDALHPQRPLSIIQDPVEISKILGRDVSDDVREIQKVYARHNLRKRIFTHGDLRLGQMLQNSAGRLCAVLDLDNFTATANPLHDIEQFSKNPAKLFHFIKLLNKAYQSCGLSIRISEHDAYFAMKNRLYGAIISDWRRKRDLDRMAENIAALDRLVGLNPNPVA